MLVPEEFCRWELLCRWGLGPVDPVPFFRACAGGLALAAFAEALRASGRSVRCERAGGSAQLRCRTELRYRSGMTPEEVGL